MLNIRCFLSCVQIFEHFLNTLRPHFCVALCHLAVGAKIALKRGKKNCKPLFRDLHFLCELFRSRIIKFYVIWLKNVVFRLFAHSFRPRPPFNPIFSFSLKTHNGAENAAFCLSKVYKTLHYLLFVYIRFVIYSNCKSQAGKPGFFYTQKRKKAGRMKNTKKEKEEEKRCAACVWRDRKTATPLCALPRCIYEEREPRRDKVKRYGEV